MDRQVGHRAAGLRATDLYTPAVIDEALHHVGGEREGRVGPQVLVVVRPFHALDVVEAAHRNGVRAVGQAAEHTGHGQADVAGVVAVAEGLPLQVLGAIEVVADILDRRDFLHRLLAEEGRTNGAYERHVRCRSHLGDVAQQRDILRPTAELIVRNGRGDRLTTGGVVFLSIGMDVQAALGDLWRVLKVLHQMILADIQQLDAHVATEVSLIDQRLDSAPGRFDPLEVFVMHDGIQLTADLRVQGGDVLIQQHLVEALDFLRRLLQQIQENTDRGRDTFISGGFGKCIVILVHLDIG
ncbi:hypothetical protein D9M71_509440 [compost metagenome]